MPISLFFRSCGSIAQKEIKVQVQQHMATLIVFPTQLFEQVVPAVTVWAGHKIRFICLVEEPLIFFDKEQRPLAYHKLKLAWLRACMRYYWNHVLQPFCDKGGIQCRYVDYGTALAATWLPVRDTLVIARDPTDALIVRKYQQLCPGIRWLETPMFVMNNHDMAAASKHHVHRNVDYFALVKRKLNRHIGLKSYDAANRKPLPRGGTCPPDPQPNYSRGHLAAYYTEASAWVNAMFPDNPGSLDALPSLPITRADAQKHMASFFTSRFQNYGPYQDAISADSKILYHSHLSFLLNVGLLTPVDVLHAAEDRWAGHPDTIASFEGFIRQLIGWREYMRYLYVEHYANIADVFGPDMHGQRMPAAWYQAATGIGPLDTEIQKALQCGYAHHIVRLMVFLNIGKLMGAHPAALYKWFMEVVALDAYEWVMLPNIAAMGHYIRCGPKFMQKPYISTSNYILRMSDYKRGPWCDTWDALFYSFLIENKANLVGGARVYLRNLSHFERKTRAQRTAMLATARQYRSSA